MKTITPIERAFFIQNETNIRLCNRVNGKLSYITIPFMDKRMVLKAAGILKDCGIVDGYDEKKNELLAFKHRLHTDAQGRQMIASFRTTIKWSDLSLTRDDVKLFAAHFAFQSGAEIIQLPQETAPVIQMHPRTPGNNSKRTA